MVTRLATSTRSSTTDRFGKLVGGAAFGADVDLQTLDEPASNGQLRDEERPARGAAQGVV